VTAHLNIHGFHSNAEQFGALRLYGSDAPALSQLMEADASLGEQLHPALPYIAAEVVWAAREEMARTVEDVLARRTRALFLNAKAAVAMAPLVADLLARELQHDSQWKTSQVQSFAAVARSYLLGLG